MGEFNKAMVSIEDNSSDDSSIYVQRPSLIGL